MIEEAIKIAKRSSTGKYAMGCVIYGVNGRLVSNGWAHVPSQRNWRMYSMHAEQHALIRGRHIRLEGSTAYVAAISRKSDMLTTARPCKRCIIALRAAGVYVVHYTTPTWDDLGTIYTGTLDTELSLAEFKVYNLRDA